MCIERERGISLSIRIYIYIYIHTHISTYIYIYIHNIGPATTAPAVSAGRAPKASSSWPQLMSSRLSDRKSGRDTSAKDYYYYYYYNNYYCYYDYY